MFTVDRFKLGLYMKQRFRLFEHTYTMIRMACVPFFTLVSGLRIKYRLHELYKREDKLYNKYQMLRNEAETQEEKERLNDEENSDFFLIRDEIDTLVTGHLCSRATELFVPLPDRKAESFWRERHPHSGRYVLTPEGIARIRAAIRQEKREWREPLVTLLPLLIGLIGAICALITIIKS